MNFSWMAWTPPTAIFFVAIFALIAGMGVWERVQPGGAQRVGILRIETTRGDRLFISLLASAFVHLAWLGLTDFPLWIATGLSALLAIAVFRWV